MSRIRSIGGADSSSSDSMLGEAGRGVASELPSSRSANLPLNRPINLHGVGLSLVLPCYNEEALIEKTIREVSEWFADAGIDGEIIVTNDGSKDGTLAVLQKLQLEIPNLVVVNHTVNRGYGAAVRSGCDRATKAWIAFMDSDGQFRSRDLERMFPLTTDADYVTGIREHRADTFVRWLNSRMYQTFVRVALGVKPADLNCGLKLFRRTVWRTIRPTHATGALINAEMFYNMKNAGIRWEQTLVPHYPRLAGTPTGANLRVILRTFKELWKLKVAKDNANLATAGRLTEMDAEETVEHLQL